MSPRPNMAQRAARWSAEHRRAAILGWLALVIASVFIGGAVGTKQLADEDLGSGQARQADQILAKAGFNQRANEEILIQARSSDLTVNDPRFRAAVASVVARLHSFPTVTEIKSPL